MHSSRAGLLKVVFVASLYFGFTNSGITPPLASSCSAYGASAKISWLIEPGYGE